MKRKQRETKSLVQKLGKKTIFVQSETCFKDENDGKLRAIVRSKIIALRSD